MKPTLSFSLLLAFAGLTFGQAARIPPCNANANVTTDCTDYFGVANYANSPLPTSSIATITIAAAGSGYANPTVVITDPIGSGATATTSTDANGAITAVTVTNGGSGYIAPVITIVDNPPAGAAGGTGALVNATLTGATGGIRKFVDNLAMLPIAVPDTTTFPESDYYVIAVREYTQKMHTDLGPTTLRGYVQLNNGTDAKGQNTIAPPAISYLGPLIVAQRNRPVRILFRNMLDPNGQLFVPVDTTYMGADPSYSQQRASLHLHGGNTPWISDGTPHQWTVPEGDASATHARGASTQFVPDMFFDASHNVVPVPACSSTVTTACYPNHVPQGVNNDPGPGRMTFYWTNQQGGRLLFFHDHAYGLTRLNVYVGEAAGYLIYDPNEETTLANATVPGTITANGADLAHLIPLVIQDKTFVASTVQMQGEDPTWINHFGSNPQAGAVSGDLWYPHVYMPNQNPGDAENTNAFGRWDYGAWFWPPQDPTTFVKDGQPKDCTSAAYLDPTSNAPITLTCPGTPNPSGTPEAFLDTPVINGVAYPVLHVAPAAYRFHLLSAGNDRTWNLQLYVADPTGKEVKMVSAIPSPTGNCTVPINQPSLGVGLASAVLDAKGNPVNGTGIPANCWPSTWPTDGREGGVPDPTTAGPPIIQIGNESGLLPTPVVIPSTPVNFEYGRRSVTVLNVATHGLMLGPAERADAIIDFSAFAGKTLILYNDAPAPIPAFDSRFDYYTGDPDQTSTGGAPSTQPGYGPNTRTLMQIVVDGAASNATPFSLSSLMAAFKSTAAGSGAFAQVQNQILVPEPTYNTAYNLNLPQTYSKIQDTKLSFTPLGGTAPQTIDMKSKAIQELFTLDYGRMNATLGTELPLTNFLTQTTIPLSFIDPATELVHPNETQLWKITHNGVDTHFIHFHLFDVQVINRVGWDGTIRPPDANELGWKDTVRMNPLEDIVVALKPLGQQLPWPVPDSIRLMDVTDSTGSTTQFTNVDPFTNNPAPTVNALANYGWEYVWHCHILGHEENDMMRPIIFQVPPPAPPVLTAAMDKNIAGQVNLIWQDASASESSFTVERATDATFTTGRVIVRSAPASSPSTAWGGTMQTTDKPGVGTFYYRIQAVDDNFSLASGLAQSYNAQPATLSTWTVSGAINTAQPIISVTPPTLAFPSQVINTTSAAMTVTIRNTGSALLSITRAISGTNGTEFAVSNSTCPVGGIAANGSCTIGVTFRPTATGARSASLVISSNDLIHPTTTIALSGTGTLASALTLNPTALSFTQVVGSTSAAQSITVRNSGTTTLTNLTVTIIGTNRTNFSRTTTCGTSLQANRTCIVSVSFSPTASGTATATLQVSAGSGSSATASLTGTATAPVATISASSLSFGTQRRFTTTTNTLTLSNTGNAPLVINSITISPFLFSSFTQTNNCPTGNRSLSAGSSCTITVRFTPLTTGGKSATLTVNVAAPANPVQVSLTGTGR